MKPSHALTPDPASAGRPPAQACRVLAIAAVAGIVGLAAALRLSNLGSLGYANHYYAAAVLSMLQSWHNFLFVAAEPGGSVSVDKPPVGLWLQVRPPMAAHVSRGREACR